MNYCIKRQEARNRKYVYVHVCAHVCYAKRDAWKCTTLLIVFSLMGGLE